MNPIPVRHFYMIRHGETVANVRGIVAGSFDTPLTEKGRQQAQNARVVFDGLTPAPTAFVHTGLSRSQETSEILNTGLNLEILCEPDLAEQFFGDWTGQKWALYFERWKSGETPAQGESLAVFCRRVMSGLRRLFEAYPEDVLAIVTHGGVFDALFYAYGLRIPDVSNCELFAFMPAADHQDGFPWKVTSHKLSPNTKKPQDLEVECTLVLIEKSGI